MAPKVSAPRPIPWPDNLPDAIELQAGRVTLPRALKKAIWKDQMMYREQSAPLCEARLDVQRRLDKSHWRAVALEERALEPPPMPTWRLATYGAGTLAVGILFGLIAGSMAH